MTALDPVRAGVARVLPRWLRRRIARTARTALALVTGTVRICMRYRVTGLAAEASYFALLSLPPLVLSLAASVGFLGDRWGDSLTASLKTAIEHGVGHFLTPDAVSSVVSPTLNEVFGGGRIDVLSLGFVIALWSGSRVLNVFVDTVSIMYGLGGRRGIVRTRALSLTLYVLGLAVAVVIIPMLLLGPGVLSHWLQPWFGGAPAILGGFSWYWLTLTVVTIFVVTSLYHVAAPVRTPWLRDLPGAVLALTLWALASVVLRLVLAESVGGTSIYGPLSAPIVVLIWFYSLSITVLIGAALNAAVDERYPHPARLTAASGQRSLSPSTPGPTRPGPAPTEVVAVERAAP